MNQAGVIKLSPSVLEWAAGQAGATLHEVASKVSARRYELIEQGQLTPTQAEKFARIVNVPFGYLFFTEPPVQRPLPIADLRTVQDREPLGQEFFETYDDIVYKQEWFVDYLTRVGAEPLPFVGSFEGTREQIPAIAADMRQKLGLTSEILRAAKNKDELFSLIAERVEAAGILVFKNGVVGNNTRRGLPVAQFRGFAIVDPLAPAVFVNGADAKAAWVFTLLHEVAHIWIGESGVSDAAPGSSAITEVVCNAVAAEILVPLGEFIPRWSALESLPVPARIEALRRDFKVSGLVIARRALDQGLISLELYREIYAAARKAGTESSGGDFYRTLGARNGKRFARTVADLAYAGDIGLRQAGRLLNTTPSNVLNYRDRIRALPA
uniref:ImmA/IrrE family metallo-endopeptidase n=1 Tax=Hylemonella sp. TaxID=2066020 RepID=UPI0035B26F88